MAWRPSARVSGSGSSWASRWRPWPANPKPPVWSGARCSSGSGSSKPSRCSGSSCPSSSARRMAMHGLIATLLLAAEEVSDKKDIYPKLSVLRIDVFLVADLFGREEEGGDKKDI